MFRISAKVITTVLLVAFGVFGVDYCVLLLEGEPMQVALGQTGIQAILVAAAWTTYCVWQREVSSLLDSIAESL